MSKGIIPIFKVFKRIAEKKFVPNKFPLTLPMEISKKILKEIIKELLDTFSKELVNMKLMNEF